MSQITIQGPERAIRAGTWAEKYIKSNWQMDVQGGPFSNFYKFSFSDPHDATFFALKWQQ